MNNVYIGNLHFDATIEELIELFIPYGQILDSNIVMDREKGRSRGFGFVLMENEQQAQLAIDNLNGMRFKGRKLIVNFARPRETRHSNHVANP